VAAKTTSENTAYLVRRTTRVGLAANLLLSLAKFLIGIFTRSQACIADAVHSLSDSVTDIAVIVGVEYWNAPADATHPHGHRRIETLVTLFIGCSLGTVAVLLAWRAVHTIGVKHDAPLGWPIFVIATASIICKEWLYRWTAAAGARCHSSALVANAWHHRSDALSSVPVALAALATGFWPSILYLDHIAAILVSVMLLKAAWDIAWPSLQELADAGADEQVRTTLLKLAAEVPGVREAHRLRTRRIGPGYAVDLHVLVAAEMTVREGHDICDAVRTRLIEYGPRIIDVLVHLEPFDPRNRETALEFSETGKA
jgi:cation diffusion facilitator family transporter